ncbi:GNAT family acetyltransferase [Cupriavidus cauae]|uniref:GNAT family acetyltransferase n=1 Tax=Cupriavidus cauae TaxID=2608999 RepID=UPI002243DC81|nr:GNAT family acetyltransferase [Cupriavidus cauae]UZN49759.1 GNAT family acetyltransferase [Cupriavidus cauae]
MQIRTYRESDEAEVVSLWKHCGLTRPWNDPHRDIARKLAEQPELFLVGEVDGRLMATAMVGYDGHRGWIYYLAVHGDFQGRGHGRQLMAEAERLLMERGCPKLNLQVRAGNEAVLAFYRELGYAADATVTLGKRLIPDN